MGYRILLLDADETLMDFKKAEAYAIETTLKAYGLPHTEEILKDYSVFNKSCWLELEQGKMDRKTLLVERFRRLFEKYNFPNDPAVVRLTYQKELGKGAFMFPGAYELLKELRETHRLYILTNGVAETQHSRFALCGLDQLVDEVFVSEEIGSSKPSKAFFDGVFARIPDFHMKDALMIGDSLTSDIQGGINAGVDTCWYNPERKAKPEDMKITYEIHSLSELKSIVN